MKHQDGFEEEEENTAKDYLAIHVYDNPNKDQKVLEDRNPVSRGLYKSIQTIMHYLELPAANYLNGKSVLNMVLAQYKRTKDLYFNVRVFASAPFKITRPQMNYNFSDSVKIP